MELRFHATSGHSVITQQARTEDPWHIAAISTSAKTYVVQLYPYIRVLCSWSLELPPGPSPLTLDLTWGRTVTPLSPSGEPSLSTGSPVTVTCPVLLRSSGSLLEVGSLSPFRAANAPAPPLLRLLPESKPTVRTLCQRRFSSEIVLARWFDGARGVLVMLRGAGEAAVVFLLWTTDSLEEGARVLLSPAQYLRYFGDGSLRPVTSRPSAEVGSGQGLSWTPGGPPSAVSVGRDRLYLAGPASLAHVGLGSWQAVMEDFILCGQWTRALALVAHFCGERSAGPTKDAVDSAGAAVDVPVGEDLLGGYLDRFLSVVLLPPPARRSNVAVSGGGAHPMCSVWDEDATVRGRVWESVATTCILYCLETHSSHKLLYDNVFLRFKALGLSPPFFRALSSVLMSRPRTSLGGPLLEEFVTHCLNEDLPLLLERCVIKVDAPEEDLIKVVPALTQLDLQSGAVLVLGFRIGRFNEALKLLFTSLLRGPRAIFPTPFQAATAYRVLLMVRHMISRTAFLTNEDIALDPDIVSSQLRLIVDILISENHVVSTLSMTLNAAIDEKWSELKYPYVHCLALVDAAVLMDTTAMVYKVLLQEERVAGTEVNLGEGPGEGEACGRLSHRLLEALHRFSQGFELGERGPVTRGINLEFTKATSAAADQQSGGHMLSLFFDRLHPLLESHTQKLPLALLLDYILYCRSELNASSATAHRSTRTGRHVLESVITRLLASQSSFRYTSAEALEVLWRLRRSGFYVAFYRAQDVFMVDGLPVMVLSLSELRTALLAYQSDSDVNSTHVGSDSRGAVEGGGGRRKSLIDFVELHFRVLCGSDVDVIHSESVEQHARAVLPFMAFVARSEPTRFVDTVKKYFMPFLGEVIGHLQRGGEEARSALFSLIAYLLSQMKRNDGSASALDVRSYMTRDIWVQYVTVLARYHREQLLAFLMEYYEEYALPYEECLDVCLSIVSQTPTASDVEPTLWLMSSSNDIRSLVTFGTGALDKCLSAFEGTDSNFISIERDTAAASIQRITERDTPGVRNLCDIIRMVVKYCSQTEKALTANRVRSVHEQDDGDGIVESKSEDGLDKGRSHAVVGKMELSEWQRAILEHILDRRNEHLQSKYSVPSEVPLLFVTCDMHCSNDPISHNVSLSG